VARRQQALAAYQDIIPLIRELRGAGNSLRVVAARLKDLGHTTRSGKAWTAAQVKRVMDMVMVG
jgi:hypothetical protein